VDLVSRLGQRGEKRSSHGRNRSLESHSETVVELLRANDTVLAGVHHESTKARVGWVLLVELWQEMLVIDGNNAGNV